MVIVLAAGCAYTTRFEQVPPLADDDPRELKDATRKYKLDKILGVVKKNNDWVRFNYYGKLVDGRITGFVTDKNDNIVEVIIPFNEVKMIWGQRDAPIKSVVNVMSAIGLGFVMILMGAFGG